MQQNGLLDVQDHTFHVADELRIGRRRNAQNIVTIQLRYEAKTILATPSFPRKRESMGHRVSHRPMDPRVRGEDGIFDKFIGLNRHRIFK
jgi:hypothetical protein